MGMDMVFEGWGEVTSGLEGSEWSQSYRRTDDIHSILVRRQVHQWSPMMQKK